MQHATRISKTITELTLNYHEDIVQGVWALDDKLEVRPAYQREFVYNEKQQVAVIETIMSDLPINIIQWNKVGNRYQVLDGQQRIISICRFRHGKFQWRGMYYDQLLPKDKQQFDNYQLDIYVYEFETREEVARWFRVINTGGVQVNEQELLNSSYTGPWLSDAKSYFSKGNASTNNAAKESKGYVKATVETQGYLTVILKYLSEMNNKTIEEYMREHYMDEDASTLQVYFKAIMRWAKRVHEPYNGLTDCVNWGKLWSLYKDSDLDNVAERVDELMLDEEVDRHTDLIEYVLGGCVDTKLLHLRTFDKKLMDKKYIEQHGVCPICGKKYDRKDMAGDHKIPWARGGKTVYDNLQMLCKTCNAKKSDCAPVEEEEE